MKKFWKKTEGFTLVELIVVIAILGILAGIGTVGYSGYVKKANMAADQQLVSNIANALQLQYYANPTAADSGYVILSTEKTEVDAADGFAAGAMDAAFGAGAWNGFKLKYNGWSDNGLLELVVDYTDDELDLIANSSFLTHSDSKGLMSSVNGLTNLVGDVIREKSSDPEKARKNLTTIFGADSEILDKLDALEADGLKDEDYPTAISNLLVNAMASTVESEPYLQALMNQYAAAYAYGEMTGDWKAYEKMQDTLENISMDELSYEGEYAADMGKLKMWEGMTAYDAVSGEDVYLSDYAGFLTYVEETGAEQIADDEEALKTMMGAVKQISNSFLGVESVTNPDLFATGEVADQVDNYLNSVKALASMDADAKAALSGLDAGMVAVFVTGDGAVSAVPSAVWMAS